MSERDGAAKRRRERRLRSWGQTRAADRRNGPGRGVAPLSSKETEDCQGRSAARSPWGPWAAEGDGARLARCPTGTEASVSWGAVAGHAALGWSGDGGVGRLHPRLPHTGCPGGEEEGRGGEGGEGEGEGGAEEAAEAAGIGTGVLGAPGHPCRAPFGAAGCQAQWACGAWRARGCSRFPAGEEEEEEEEEEEAPEVFLSFLFRWWTPLWPSTTSPSSPWSSSSWCLGLRSSTTFGHSRCATTGTWFFGAENCGRSAVAVLRWPSTFFSCRRCWSPWSSLLSRSWRFHSCCLFWWSMSLLCESCRFSGAAVEKPLALPQLQLVEKSVVLYVPSYLAVTCSVFAFGVQDSGLFWVMTSGNVPVFSAYWFNTGYMSTSVHGGFW